MAQKKRPAAKKAKKSGLKKARPRKRVGPARLKASAREGGIVPNPEPVAVTHSGPASPQPPALTREAIDAFRALTEEVIRLREGQAREREESAREREEHQDFRKSVLGALRDITERIKHSEDLQRQAPQTSSVDADTMRLRVAFAGGCRALGIDGPTPAIIGRAMHDANAFSMNTALTIVPRTVFEGIYAQRARGVPDHLSPKITSLLENLKPENSAKTARLLGEEFDARLQVVVDANLGEKLKVYSGGKTTYRRVLTQLGARVFRKWPDWADASGGVVLAEPPDSSPSTPGPAPTPEEPLVTMPAVENDHPSEPSSIIRVAPARED
jgi:hypothetical protein